MEGPAWVLMDVDEGGVAEGWSGCGDFLKPDSNEACLTDWLSFIGMISL